MSTKSITGFDYALENPGVMTEGTLAIIEAAFVQCRRAKDPSSGEFAIITNAAKEIGIPRDYGLYADYWALHHFLGQLKTATRLTLTYQKKNILVGSFLLLSNFRYPTIMGPIEVTGFSKNFLIQVADRKCPVSPDFILDVFCASFKPSAPQ